MREDARTNAAAGTNVGGAAYVSPLVHFGFPKSTPIFGGPPPAVEVGLGPNTGASIKSSTEFRPAGVKFMDYLLGSNREQTRGSQ
ncbi:MAG: hypothetical protein AB7Q37_12795 [Pyrinomonadaceae bacterium]